MNKKLDLTELLKDCPKGTEFYSRCIGVVKFDSIDDTMKRIIVKNEREIISYKENGVYYYADENAEIDLFPSKEQKDWSKWQRPFVDGDIIATNNGHFIGIFKVKNNVSFETYCAINDVGSLTINTSYYFGRFATEEEKQKLFDAIKANGYVWNNEAKILKRLIVPKFKVGDIVQNKYDYKVRITEVNIEDELYGYESLIANGIGGFSFNEQDNWKLIVKPKFKIGDKIRHKSHTKEENIITEIKDTYYILDDELALPFVNQDNYELISNKFNPKTLKPFDRVLVRDIGCNMCWRIQFFESIHECNKNYPFMCLGSRLYSFCIPYNDDTKHLIEKSEEAPEFYRYWED